MLLVAYALAVYRFQRDAGLVERDFSVGHPSADHLEVNVEILGVHPLRDALQVRFTFHPNGRYVADRFGHLKSDLRVVLTTSDGYRSVRLPAGEVPAQFTADINLADGTVNAYPFDSYKAVIGVAAFAHAKPGDDFPLPLSTEIHYTAKFDDYVIRTNIAPESTVAAVDVDLHIWRSAAIVTFAAMMYSAITLVAISVFAITVMVFFGRLRPETGIMLWSGAMVFALPAVRNALPGSPPLGVQVDLYVFMWAQTAVAFSMVMQTIMWLRHNARQLRPGEPEDATFDEAFESEEAPSFGSGKSHEAT